MLQKIPISVFNDNYVWALHNQRHCIIVDPGAAAPVLEFLHSQQLQLAAILITHHHHDHIDDIDELLHHYPVPVYGQPSINGITHPVKDKDTVMLLGATFTAIAVPGHTLDHIAWYSATEAALFCGDTLFGGGCGRIFEGTAAMMFQSLQKLASLPANTQVFCAHEYTLANLRFALAIEPDNRDIQQRFSRCEILNQQKQCTLPSTLIEELQTNPFLRVHENTVIIQAMHHGARSNAPEDVFTCLRQWKNHF